LSVHATPQLDAAVARLQARIRQQSALAELGRIAIGFRGLGALLREAARLAAATLDAELAAIEERLPDGKMRLAAGMGFGEGSEPELETACFRVAQEALTNVARHAHARNVRLGLRHHRAGLELSVRDDGTGFDVRAARDRAGAGASMGLLGMEERVSLLGGDLEILCPPHGGTELRARFPSLRQGGTA
jgi:signal transduction histidine kinase